jgi:hypothetical protein
MEQTLQIGVNNRAGNVMALQRPGQPGQTGRRLTGFDQRRMNKKHRLHLRDP